ncbi:HOOK protein-domain-containing protein [Lipomyces japonicus]|uniref:HOOK protein-domain-containing protein n=1 Tax=Lipomyces japonicus TaxID=56871 RepID=UPI0034CD2B0A
MAMSTDLDAALLAWVNQLADVPHVNNLAELADGVVVSRILDTIDADAFSEASIGPPPNGQSSPSFITRVQQLKRLFKALEAHLQQLTGYELDPADVPNVSLIAKDAEPGQVTKLLKVVFITAASSAGPEYLSGIDVDDESKTQLRSLLAQSSQSTPASQQDEAAAPTTTTATTAVANKPQEIQESETNNHTISDLERSFADLQLQNATLHDQVTAVTTENFNLKQDIASLTSSSKVALDVATGKAQTEIAYLQKDVHDLEGQVADKTAKLASAEQRLRDQQARLEAMQDELDRVDELKDGLDEAKHEMNRLRKFADQVEKYKTQVDVLDDVRKQLQAARNENTYLIEKANLLDEDTQQIFGLRKQVDVLANEVEFFRRKSKDADSVLASTQTELGFLNDKVSVLEYDHARDLDIISALEDRCKEAEAGGLIGNQHQDTIKDAQDRDLVLTIADLQFEISRLNHELEDQKTNASLINVQATINDDDEDANDYLEQIRNLLDAVRKKDDELKRTVLSMQAIQKRYDDLSEKNATLEADYALVDKDKKQQLVEIRRSASRKLSVVQKDFDSLTAHAKNQTELLNKALLEKESIYQKLTSSHEELLEVSRANTTLRMSLASVDNGGNSGSVGGFGGYESELKSWVIDLQKKVETQREKLRKSHEFVKKIKAENDKLKLFEHDSNLTKQNVITVEEAVNIRRELALMTSAWYALTARIQQSNVVVVKKVQDSPASWLNRQRKILEDKR